MNTPAKQQKIDNLPPVISNMLDNLNDKSLNLFVRDNYAASLESIERVIVDQLTAFYKERTKANAEQTSIKKRK